MTNDQLNEGNRLRREIRYERDFLRRHEFDIEMGGRNSSYSRGDSLDEESKAQDQRVTEQTKKRMAALEAKFAAL